MYHLSNRLRKEIRALCEMEFHAGIIDLQADYAAPLEARLPET